MQANAEPVDARVRRRLRELRTPPRADARAGRRTGEHRHLDLVALESGKRRLALDHIPALAGALGVTTDELLHTAPVPDPRVRGEPRRFEGMTMWELSREAAALRAFKMLVAPSAREPPHEFPVHEGHEWLYVISGRLRLILGDHD